MSLSADKDAEIIEAFNTTSRYLDDLLNILVGVVSIYQIYLLNIDNTYFDGMLKQIYPSELQLNKANSADTGTPFLDLHLIISGGFVSSKIYDKRDDFDFDVVGFPFLDEGVPCAASCGVYMSQLNRFARVSGHVADFGTGGRILIARLLGQGCRYHELRKTFSKFYRRRCGLASEFNTGLRSLLEQGLSELGFCGDLVCKVKMIVGRADFSGHFGEVVVSCRGVGCSVGVVRRAVCLVVGLVSVDGFAGLFNCKLSWLGPDDLSLVGPTGIQLLDFYCSSVSELVCY